MRTRQYSQPGPRFHHGNTFQVKFLWMHKSVPHHDFFHYGLRKQSFAAMHAEVCDEHIYFDTDSNSPPHIVHVNSISSNDISSSYDPSPSIIKRRPLSVSSSLL